MRCTQIVLGKMLISVPMNPVLRCGITEAPIRSAGTGRRRRRQHDRALPERKLEQAPCSVQKHLTRHRLPTLLTEHYDPFSLIVRGTVLRGFATSNVERYLFIEAK